MQAKGLTIPTTFTAIDRFRPTVQGMVNSLEGFTAKARAFSSRSERMFRRLTPAIGETQKQLLSMVGTGAIVTGAFQLGRSSIRSVTDYETAIQSLQAVTGVSNEQLTSFKREILDVARTSKKSSVEVTKSFEVVGSVMSQYLENPKALRMITEAGITLSKASRMELEPSLMSLTSVMNQFGLGADQALSTVNRLTAGEIVGSIRTAEAANMLQEFGAVAKTAGVSVGEATALIEALGLQMDKTKIGVGARNILTILSAAGGLDKRARVDMRKAGVDTKFLMDNTQSLSARLHELSKISKDPIKMVSIFGKENLTAGQVIFQQLGRYDEFARRIQVTNKAQEQATINSNTFTQALERLSAKWTNMITGSEKTDQGIRKATNTVEYFTENLDTVVNVGVKVLKFYAMWKVANIAMVVATNAMSVAVGIQSGVLGVSSLALKGNTVALAAQRISMSAVSATTALATGNLTAFNAALGLTPFGWAVIGLTALAGGLYLLNEREKTLRREYENQIHARQATEIEKEANAVRKLAKEYWQAGMNAREATAAAIKFNARSVDFQRAKVEERIAKTKAELAKEMNKLYFADLFTGAFGEGPAMYGRRAALSEQLNAQQQTAGKLAADKRSIVELAAGDISRGLISRSDIKGVFGNSTGASSNNEARDPYYIGSQKSKYDIPAWTRESMNTMITIKNESNNEAEVKAGGKSKSIMPQTTSTMTVKK